MRAAVAAAALAVALLLAWAPVTHADGDPASDVLIQYRTFLPYNVKLPRASTQKLDAVIAKAKAKGYSVRVAMLDHDFDMGSAGVLWDRPQIYAKFLAQELAQFNRDWVLAVMPDGYGLFHCTPKRRKGGYSDPCEGQLPMAADLKLLKALPSPQRSRQDEAAAGAEAVTQLAALHGADVGGSSPVVPIVIVVAVVVVAAGGLLALRGRRRARTR